jgi:thiamine biosynthesis lipoprotein ApbE
VTVLAETASVAEAVSTAMLVEGRGAVHELARRLGVDACWIDASGVHPTV